MIVSKPYSTTVQKAAQEDNLGKLVILLFIIWAALIIYAMYGVFLWRRGEEILTIMLAVNHLFRCSLHICTLAFATFCPLGKYLAHEAH